MKKGGDGGKADENEWRYDGAKEGRGEVGYHESGRQQEDRGKGNEEQAQKKYNKEGGHNEVMQLINEIAESVRRGRVVEESDGTTGEQRGQIEAKGEIKWQPRGE